MSSSSRALLFALALTLYVEEIASAETLCGGELVDALQFVCEDRGFYFSRFRALLGVFFVLLLLLSATGPRQVLRGASRSPCVLLFVRAQTVWIAEAVSVRLWLCAVCWFVCFF